MNGEQLRAWADELDRRERNTCTGLSAAWCPLHGNCVCPDRATALDDFNCPLHAPTSLHAEPVPDFTEVGR